MFNQISVIRFIYTPQSVGYQYTKYIAAYFIINNTTLGTHSLQAFTDIMTNDFKNKFYLI